MTILYLGDDTIETSAAYLCGAMDHLGHDFVHVSSDDARIDSFDFDLFVLSDFPARTLGMENSERIVEKVEGGSGLLMIGGWESFHGSDGNYDSNPIGDILPVLIEDRDDRVNSAHPAVVRRVATHPAIGSLEFDPSPSIAGFNRVTSKSESQEVLVVERYLATREDGFSLIDRNPLLVCGLAGRGRTAALMTDVAPHWVGGLVDWGESRIEIDRFGVDVGDRYIDLLGSLLGWCTGEIG